MKRQNLRIIVIEEGTEKQTKGMNNLFNEIITENYPNMNNEMENQVQEAYRTPNIQNYNRPIPRHIIMKRTNIENKDRILKAVRERIKLHSGGNQYGYKQSFQSRP